MQRSANQKSAKVGAGEERSRLESWGALDSYSEEQPLGSSDDAGGVHTAAGEALELLAFFGGELDGQVLTHTVVCAEHMKLR
jgi:hypothetical protein